MRKKREKKQFPFFFFFFFLRQPTHRPSSVSNVQLNTYIHARPDCPARVPKRFHRLLPCIKPPNPHRHLSLSIFVCRRPCLHTYIHTYIHTHLVASPLKASSPSKSQRPVSYPNPHPLPPSRHAMPCNAALLPSSSSSSRRGKPLALYVSVSPSLSLSLSLSLFSTPARICIRDASSSYFVHLHTCMRHRLSRRCNACIRQ
ncbi:hypothetical protein IWX50DRAFT_380713 [Phyllosticta citricarpa]